MSILFWTDNFDLLHNATKKKKEKKKKKKKLTNLQLKDIAVTKSVLGSIWTLFPSLHMCWPSGVKLEKPARSHLLPNVGPGPTSGLLLPPVQLGRSGTNPGFGLGFVCCPFFVESHK